MAFIREYGMMGDPWERSQLVYAGGFFSNLKKRLKPPPALRKLTLGQALKVATPLLPFVPGVGTLAAAGLAGIEHFSSGGRRVLQALQPVAEEVQSYVPRRVQNADVEMQPVQAPYTTSTREAAQVMVLPEVEEPEVQLVEDTEEETLTPEIDEEFEAEPEE